MRPLLLLLLALSACAADPPPPAVAPAGPPSLGCQLAAPKKSDDACATDADCGPSQPCHAPACVARARSQPRTPQTMCTEILVCGTTDANRCGCFEGRCALIPPAPPATP